MISYAGRNSEVTYMLNKPIDTGFKAMGHKLIMYVKGRLIFVTQES
jgi:hypothetical protein